MDQLNNEKTGVQYKAPIHFKIFSHIHLRTEILQTIVEEGKYSYHFTFKNPKHLCVHIDEIKPKCKLLVTAFE